MSRVLNLIFCLMFAGFVAGAGRRVRSTDGQGSQGGSSSYASSSSSSGSFGGSSGGTGFGSGAPYAGGNPGFPFPGNFVFPTGPLFPGFPNPGFPVPGLMDPYQQWLAQFNAAQQAAQQQAALHQAFMANLFAQQQGLAAQIPTSYPNVDSNAIAPDARIGSPSDGAYSVGSGSYSGSSDSAPQDSYGGSQNSRSGTRPGNFVFTGASIQSGPQGGRGVAISYPGGPDGLGVRISEEYGPPGGMGTHAVFTSSSSGTSTINGKTTSYKTSTFGKNDNGKITFKTINE